MVYQIYPRSFQDSDGDGVGDLRGMLARLDHLAELGVDAVWLSPFYPSPFADGGYDISDFTGVDPRLGTVADVARARRRAARPRHGAPARPRPVPHLDRAPLVPRAPRPLRVGGRRRRTTGGRRSAGRPGRGTSAPAAGTCTRSTPSSPTSTGASRRSSRRCRTSSASGSARARTGSASTRSTGSLSTPTCSTTRRATEPFPFPEPPDVAALDRRHSSHWTPGLAAPLAALRAAAGDAFLVGEVYRPTDELGPYLDHLDTAFVFELMFAPLAGRRGRAGSSAAPPWRAVVDALQPRLRPRRSRDRGGQQRVAAMLLLTLPGPAFVYQGDEIGLARRPGRRSARRPLTAATAPATRCSGAPGRAAGSRPGAAWLPPVDPAARNVADQRARPGLAVRALPRAHPASADAPRRPRVVAADPGGLLVYRRGDATVALNLGAASCRSMPAGEVLLATAPASIPAASVPGGVVTRSSGNTLRACPGTPASPSSTPRPTSSGPAGGRCCRRSPGGCAASPTTST